MTTLSSPQRASINSATLAGLVSRPGGCHHPRQARVGWGFGTGSDRMATDHLPDVIAPGLSILFCGINPGASSAARGCNFADHSNRFWKAIHGAGLTPKLLTAAEDQSLIDYGIGLTTAAQRPSRQASEISRAELQEGSTILMHKVTFYKPRALAFLGKPAFSAIMGSRSVTWGRQAVSFGGAPAWVVPNPSGLNRRFSLSQLIEAYSELKNI